MTNVIVCGAPTSGNRAVLKALKQLPSITGHIIHGMSTGDMKSGKLEGEHYSEILSVFREKHIEGETFAIFPVRHLVYREQSGAFRTMHIEPHHISWMHNIIGAITLHLCIPWLTVSYEAFIESPKDHIKWLLSWMELDHLIDNVDDLNLSWMKDGNQKYRDHGGKTTLPPEHIDA